MNIIKLIEIIEKNNEIYKMLKSCPYEILKEWELFEYKKGNIFLKQGEIYPYFFIIVQGEANVFVMAENGKVYSQSIYKKGDFIGELEIFNNAPYSCSIEALTSIKILSLKREYFLKWHDMDRNISRYITEHICSQFYVLSQKSAIDTLYTLRERLCQYLIKSYEKNKSNVIKIDKETLSGQLAVTKRSLNRTLVELKEKELLNIKGNEVFINDITKIKELIKRST